MIPLSGGSQATSGGWGGVVYVVRISAIRGLNWRLLPRLTAAVAERWPREPWCCTSAEDVVVAVVVVGVGGGVRKICGLESRKIKGGRGEGGREGMCVCVCTVHAVHRLQCIFRPGDGSGAAECPTLAPVQPEEATLKSFYYSSSVSPPPPSLLPFILMRAQLIRKWNSFPKGGWAPQQWRPFFCQWPYWIPLQGHRGHTEGHLQYPPPPTLHRTPAAPSYFFFSARSPGLICATVSFDPPPPPPSLALHRPPPLLFPSKCRLYNTTYWFAAGEIASYCACLVYLMTARWERRAGVSHRPPDCNWPRSFGRCSASDL